MSFGFKSGVAGRFRSVWGGLYPVASAPTWSFPGGSGAPAPVVRHAQPATRSFLAKGFGHSRQWFCCIECGRPFCPAAAASLRHDQDRKSTRLNSSHVAISYAVFCLKKKKTDQYTWI